jgi:LemA protein
MQKSGMARCASRCQVPLPETKVRFGPARAGTAKRPQARRTVAMDEDDVIMIGIDKIPVMERHIFYRLLLRVNWKALPVQYTRRGSVLHEGANKMRPNRIFKLTTAAKPHAKVQLNSNHPGGQKRAADLAPLLNAPEPVSFAKAGGAIMNMSVNPTQNVFEPSRAARLLLRVRTFAVLALLGACISGCGYNTIPTLEEQAKAKWGDVQNQYQRRADLIPNLVATVQGYAKQEKDVLTAVVEARAKATSVKIDASQLTDPDKVKQFQEAQTQLSGALGRLLAVSENYPDLKSNQNFLALQSQLEGTENRISVARRDYIEAIRAYNTSLKTLPSLIWASTLFRANKPMAEFAANEAAQTPPQVKF